MNEKTLLTLWLDNSPKVMDERLEGLKQKDRMKAGTVFAAGVAVMTVWLTCLPQTLNLNQYASVLFALVAWLPAAVTLLHCCSGVIEVLRVRIWLTTSISLIFLNGSVYNILFPTGRRILFWDAGLVCGVIVCVLWAVGYRQYGKSQAEEIEDSQLKKISRRFRLLQAILAVMAAGSVGIALLLPSDWLKQQVENQLEALNTSELEALNQAVSTVQGGTVIYVLDTPIESNIVGEGGYPEQLHQIVYQAAGDETQLTLSITDDGSGQIWEGEKIIPDQGEGRERYWYVNDSWCRDEDFFIAFNEQKPGFERVPGEYDHTGWVIRQFSPLHVTDIQITQDGADTIYHAELNDQYIYDVKERLGRLAGIRKTHEIQSVSQTLRQNPQGVITECTERVTGIVKKTKQPYETITRIRIYTQDTQTVLSERAQQMEQPFVPQWYLDDFEGK